MTLPTALVMAALVMLAVACGSQDTREPTPTPMIDAAALLTETAGNIRTTRSVKFSVTHESGSIFIRPFSAKITEVEGSWDADLGANFIADAYLVPNPEAEPTSGTYIQMQVVITPEAYYTARSTDGSMDKTVAHVVANTGRSIGRDHGRAHNRRRKSRPGRSRDGR